MKKAFISFLGTNDYLNCRYELNEISGDVVKYVQEDIISRFCREWSKEDEIRLFTTDEAKKNNWDDNGHMDFKTKQIIPNSGLGKRLGKLEISPEVKRYDIPIGNSEEEIWQIFQAVYDTLKEGEEIIFDITHGFRSIPMLFMVLIGYARLLKGISVKGIYYGAFETLGFRNEVEKIPEDERIAPIFDLTSFEQLIEWTEATQSFIKNGRAGEFAALAKKQLSPVLKNTRGQDKVASSLNTIVKEMDKITRKLLVNRGAEIIQYDYEGLKKELSLLQNDDIFIRPLAPLMSVVEEKIDTFIKDDVNNGFKAVDWCVEHGLYQQAITMLQENMITFILAGEGLDWGVEKNRHAASEAIILTSNKSLSLDEKDPDAELIASLMKNHIIIEFSSDLEPLRPIRNDINHGGFLTEQNKKARSADSILDKFQRIYENMKKKLGKMEQ